MREQSTKNKPERAAGKPPERMHEMNDNEIKRTGEKLKYRGRVYYLKDNTIYDARLNIFIPDATNGFLDLYEYFEYFEPNKPAKEAKQ